MRVLDDRSLNGVFVNGERVDWQLLADGDEILVGRYRLTFLQVSAVPPAEATEPGRGRVTSARSMAETIAVSPRRAAPARRRRCGR